MDISIKGHSFRLERDHKRLESRRDQIIFGALLHSSISFGPYTFYYTRKLKGLFPDIRE